MIRILYIINNLDVGGAERHLLQVVPRLKQHGLEPVVFTVGQKGKLSSCFEEAGVKVVEPLFAATTRSWPRSITGPFTIIGSALSLLVFMWRFRPQFIHFFLPHAYVLGCLVSFFHMGSHRIMSRRSLNVYQLRHPFAAKVERLLHPSLDAALGNSQKVVEQLASEGIDRKRLGLIYNGLDIAAFRSASDTREVRRALGISCRSLVLILVANLIPYKGHLDLLQALASVKDELPDGWRMLCVGRDTGIGGSLRDEAQRLGVGDHVVWLGERRDISDLLAASDIGLLTSHEEGFSNSILEGMAAGLPMVVTDVGGNGEAVEDGISGLVVPARKPDLLGRAILRVAMDDALRERLGSAARQRVEDVFAIDQCVSKYVTLYKNFTMLKQGQTTEEILRG